MIYIDNQLLENSKKQIKEIRNAIQSMYWKDETENKLGFHDSAVLHGLLFNLNASLNYLSEIKENKHNGC